LKLTQLNLKPGETLMDRLEAYRNFYAKFVTSNAGVNSNNKNIIVALKSENQINNGQPTLHAKCLASLRINLGDVIVHVGAGTGYYSAILAELTGSKGNVIAYEIDDVLVHRATHNLSNYANVSVKHESGTDGQLPSCDIVYVNAGATHPVKNWLSALRPGGRLLFPLTPDHGWGGILLIIRTPAGDFSAEFLCQAMFTPCLGARDDEEAKRLGEVFTRGGMEKVKSIQNNQMPDETRWFSGKNWWLSTIGIT
jgi:protein-L-isoaspartate(D-aspartate) O-methyltransferase